MTTAHDLTAVLTLEDIADFVSRAAFDKGRAYQKQGRVTKLQISEDLSEIRARVQGGERQAYLVEVELTVQSGEIESIFGSCSCPVGYNCKHVAATLIEALWQDGAPVSPRVASGEMMKTDLQTYKAVSSSAVELPQGVLQWLDALDRASLGDEYPVTVQQRLFYVFEPFEAAQGAQPTPQLLVQPVSARLLKDGTTSSTTSRANIYNYQPDKWPKFYRRSDIEICEALTRSSRSHWGAQGFPLHDIKLIEKILATGRARWERVNGAALALGASRAGRIEWQLIGAQGVKPRLQAEGAIALNAEPPIYVDVTQSLIGPIDIGLAPRLAHQLLSAPVIAPHLVARVSQAIGARLPQVRVDLLPVPPQAPVVISCEPVPILRLIAGDRGANAYYYANSLPEVMPVAHLLFRYQQLRVEPADKRDVLEAVSEDRLLQIKRKLKSEKAFAAMLKATDIPPATQIWPYLNARHAGDFAFSRAGEWLDFLRHDVPVLQGQGFEIEVDDRFPYRLAKVTGDFEAKLESSGIDWFDLHLGIEVEGERVDLGPLLAGLVTSPGFDLGLIEQMAQLEDDIYVPVKAGRFIALAADRFLPIILALHDLNLGGLFTTKLGSLRVSKAEAAFLLGAEAEAFAFTGTEGLRHLAALVGREGPAPVALPETFKAQLRPYQAQGVAWLNALRQAGLGGILADDMGLGKTVQMLALLAVEKAQARLTPPALIVAPTSLMTNWVNEASRFAPDLKILLLHGPDRQRHFSKIGDSDVVLTTYPLIGRDHETLLANDWSFAILDEAQTIKNPNASTTKLLRDLRARHRFCLSGTPMENHLGELWSLMSFAIPGYLGDKTSFARGWRTPIEKRGDKMRAQALSRRVRPFMLRRTKTEVARDLPAKSEMIETITLEGKQRDIYDGIRLAMHDKVRAAIADRGLAKSHIIILEALLKLRQACCDPRLLKLSGKADYPSAKLDRMMEMVGELLAEGRRIIVFSQFTSMLALIRDRLDAISVNYSLLTGDTKDRKREIERFQQEEVSLFLISLKAGGVGLNLTAADTVILYDPWWNPAVEEQAIDRAYRIGQHKPVFVYRLVAKDTIEDKMADLKARKRALAEGLFDADGNPTSALTEEDVTALLEM